jgi:CRP-like cAMP-binding protein
MGLRLRSVRMSAHRDLLRAASGARTFLGRLPDDARVALSASETIVEAHRGQTSFSAMGPADRFGIVLRGIARSYLSASDGRRLTVHYSCWIPTDWRRSSGAIRRARTDLAQNRKMLAGELGFEPRISSSRARRLTAWPLASGSDRDDTASRRGPGESLSAGPLLPSGR